LISATHCILENDGRNVAVQDLDTPAGTYVNGRRVARSAPLNDGDLLRVGRLEFEVLIDRDGCEKDATAPSATPPATVDSLAEFVTTMFAEADAREREKRAADAGLREIRIRRVSSPKAQVADAPEAPSRPAPVRKRPSGPPGKLPHPPSICAQTTTTAAELALREMFEHRRWRRGIRWW
jgi:predicted component of type VI protein secretion system